MSMQSPSPTGDVTTGTEFQGTTHRMTVLPEFMSLMSQKMSTILHMSLSSLTGEGPEQNNNIHSWNQ